MTGADTAIAQASANNVLQYLIVAPIRVFDSGLEDKAAESSSRRRNFYLVQMRLS